MSALADSNTDTSASTSANKNTTATNTSTITSAHTSATATNTDAQIRHVYEQWHATVLAGDLEGLMALYAEDALFETPLVLTVLQQPEGVLHGRAAIRAFFEIGLGHRNSGLGRWYRTGTFFSNGRQLVWEYPRDTPQGDQVDLVEVMDLRGGLIAHHRVYWGWMGFKGLLAEMQKPAA